MKFLPFLYTICILNSCQINTSVSDEMDAYCECVQGYQADDKECVKLRNGILKKYEFDPESVEIIQIKLLECSKN